MQQHFLGRIYDYYFEGDGRVDHDEFLRACTLFFGEPTVNTAAEGLFNEWMLFDHRMRPPGGGTPMTLLERWISENPKNIGSMTMQKYKDLAEQNRYDWYEVCAVRLDSGLTVRAIRDGTTYEVQERSATHQLSPGYVMVTRVGLVEGVFELVGADGEAFPSAPGGRDVEEFATFLKNSPWTPVDTYRLIFMNVEGGGDFDESSMLAYEERKAIANGDALLKEIGIDTIINFTGVAERVREVCVFVETDVEEEVCSDAFAHPARLLLGLAGESVQEKRILDELFDHYASLLSSIVFGRLSAMTPYTRAKYESRYDRCAKAEVDAQDLFAWWKHYVKHIEYMEKEKFAPALTEANAMCEALFAQGVVPQSLPTVLLGFGSLCEHVGHYDSFRHIVYALTVLGGAELGGADDAQKTVLFGQLLQKQHGTKTPIDKYVAWVLTQGLDFTGDPVFEGMPGTERSRALKKRATSTGARKTSAPRVQRAKAVSKKSTK